jgi:hypothetical protein
MGLQLRLQPTARARIGRHSLAEGPLINRGGVFLIQGRGDKRFHDKPATEVYAMHLVRCPIPARVQGRCPGIGLSGIFERIIRIIIPCKVKS